MASRGRGDGSFSRGGSSGGFSRGGSSRGGGSSGTFSRGGGGFSRGGGRGGNSSRGGRGFDRGGRGGSRGRGGQSANSKTKFQDSDGEDDDEEEEAGPTVDTEGTEVPAPSTNNKSRRDNVQTSLTEDGTELPTRLNNKVFIDGLPYQEPGGENTIMDALYNFCDQWKVGKVVNLIKKPGQGFGYLVFRSPHSVQAAVNVLNDRKFMGRQLKVQVPKERAIDGSVVGEKRDRPDKLGLTTFTRQVLISDLSSNANPEVLKEVLRELNPELSEKVESIKMAGRGRKAFVTFAAEEHVEEAVALLNGFSLLGRMVCATKAQAPGTLPYSKVTLGNRVISAQPLGEGATIAEAGVDAESKGAIAGGAAGAAVAGGSKTLGGSKFDYQDQGADEVLVGNLPDHVTVEQLKSHFSTAGRIVDAEVLINEHTRQSSGIAKLRFAIPGQAKYAKEHLDGSQLSGVVLRVDRGDQASAVPGVGAPVGNADDDDDVSEVDEDAFLRHMGVTDKKAYFKGHKAPAADEPAADDDEEEEPARKRRRKEVKGGKTFGSVKRHVTSKKVVKQGKKTF